MRRTLAALLFAVLLFAGIPAGAADADEPEPQVPFTWEAVDGGVAVTRYTGEFIRNVQVPAELGGQPVVEIGPQAFGASKAHSESFVGCVVLPDSVKRIADGAFSGQLVMTDVRLPNGLEEIGRQAFYDCRGLRSLSIPDSVRLIGQGAFQSSGLRSISLPAGIDTVQERTFYACPDLELAIVPEGVTQIREGAFFGCPTLNTVCLPQTLLSVQSQAFLGCPLLYTVCYAGSEEQYAAMHIDGSMSECALLGADVLCGASQPPEAPAQPAADRILPGGVVMRHTSPLTVRGQAGRRYLVGFRATHRQSGVPYLTTGSLWDSLDIPIGVHMLVDSASGSDASEVESTLTTGCVARFYDSENLLSEATVVLMGDVMGTGDVNLTQLTRMAEAYRGTRILEGPYLMAADWQGTGKVDLTDLVREAQLYVLAS